MSFTAASLAPQSGRRVLVTGANSGIGFETARVFADRGATVTLACRNASAADAAAERIRTGTPSADLTIRLVDLADLDSVRALATALLEAGEPIDVLVNNAGVMLPPQGKTKQGFELQFGVNHLAHFVLTAALWPLLLRGDQPRVVSLSSIAAREGRLQFDDLQFERRYRGYAAYCQSKLACLSFGLELARRAEAAGRPVRSVVAHPGVSATNLQRHFGPLRTFVTALALTNEQGALPILMAAAADDVRNGECFGPTGFREIWGRPGRTAVYPSAQNTAEARRLWEISESLTGTSFTP